MTHSQVVESAYKWATRNAGCGVVFRELYNSYGEIPDVIGFGGWHSVLIECKISRSDFLADKNKAWRQDDGKGMGTFRYYCCPAGLIRLEELPPKWGLIWVDQKGRARCQFDPRNTRLFLHENPNRFDRNLEAENQFMYWALRRINVRGGLSLAYSEKQQIAFAKSTENIPDESLCQDRLY